jgi:hypothetical protein
MATAGIVVAEVNQKAESMTDVGAGSKEEMVEEKTFPELKRHVVQHSHGSIKPARSASSPSPHSQSLNPRDGGTQDTMVCPQRLSCLDGVIPPGHYGPGTNEEHREPRHGEFLTVGTLCEMPTLWTDPILHVGLQTPRTELVEVL